MLRDAPTAEVDGSVQERIQALADFLGKKGAKVSEARPDFDLAEAHRVFIQLLRAATTRGLTDALFAKHQRSAQQLDPADESYYAQMVKANTMHHRDWLYLNEKRHRMRLKWAEFFNEYDLLLCPAAATRCVCAQSTGRALGTHDRRSTASPSPPPRRCSGPAIRACPTCPPR